MPSPDEDLRILQACLTGGAEGRETFASHFRPLVRWAVRRTASARGRALPPASAEDLVQETFLALLDHDARRLRRFDPRLGLAASWISLVARQTALKRLEREAPFAPLPEVLATPLPGFDTEDLDRLREALKILPPREALCLALLFEQGMEPNRVAAALRVRRQGIYEIRDRALGRLRDLLNKSGD